MIPDLKTMYWNSINGCSTTDTGGSAKHYCVEQGISCCSADYTGKCMLSACNNIIGFSGGKANNITYKYEKVNDFDEVAQLKMRNEIGNKMIEYTSRWKDFQFRSPINVFEPDKVNPYKFDLVKWEQHEPYEVTNGLTGEKEMSTESCYTIAALLWDQREEGFIFESCGLRYLENRIDGLEEWILAFAKMKEIELRVEDD